MKKLYLLFFLISTYSAFTQTPGSESAILTKDAAILYQGHDETTPLAGQLEYKIYYDNVDGILDKPIFVVDGFDPGDSRNIDAIFNSFSAGGTDLINTVRDEGFDIIIVNFSTYNSVTDGTTIDGGADFIQRNAFSLVALLEDINGQTVTTDENVIIGPSMGGLISRYALSYMEQNSIPHETRLYISFDSPHRGANIPISIQYAFNYLVNNQTFPQASLQPALAALNTAAAKQMLVDHYLAHVDVSTNGDGVTQLGSNLPAGAPNFRDAWQTELDNIGFPQTTRNVAVINGAGDGTTIGNPGDNIIDATINLNPLLRVNPELNFTPTATNTNTAFNFTAEALVIVFWTEVDSYSADAESPSITDGVDAAPGGTTDISTLDDGSNPLLTDFVNNLNQTEYCFIPTISSLAITATDDWFALPNVSNSSSNSSSSFATPFANTFIPSTNEPHVQVTAANATFIINEILAATLSVDSFEKHFKIVQNPVVNNTLILESNLNEVVTMTIADVTGKLVYNKKLKLNNRAEIPLDLKSGFYILNITDSTEQQFIAKFLVR